MLAYTIPQQGKEEESERQRSEMRDQIQFTDLRFERYNCMMYRLFSM